MNWPLAIEHTLGIIILAVAALAAIWRLTRWAIAGARAVSKAIDAIEYIETEMQFNGGATMRDAMQRVEHRQRQFAAQLSQVMAQVTRDD